MPRLPLLLREAPDRRGGTRRMWLVAADDAYPPVEVCEGHELVVWGVVTHIIHKCRR